MKNLVVIALAMTLVSCASSKNQNVREVASSFDKDLSGTYLGVATYVKGKKKPAIRIYLNPVPNEPGSYHVVLLEYVSLLGMFPKYVLSNKLPLISKSIGFLNDITEKIEVYKAVPANKPHHYDLLELRADSRAIKVVDEANPRQLILSSQRDLVHPLEGAAIVPNKQSQPRRISFPVEKSKKDNGAEYGVAKLVYSKIGLDSTWEKEFVAGPYLSSYGNKKDVVLDLQQGDVNRAYFRVDPKFSYSNLNKEQRKKREGVFTNPKSAFLEGGFVVREPVDGMFVFSPTNSNDSADTIQEITGKIGLFIDIFDAKQKLQQYVTELAIINPEDPEDFHMHYEHPDNKRSQ